MIDSLYRIIGNTPSNETIVGIFLALAVSIVVFVIIGIAKP